MKATHPPVLNIADVEMKPYPPSHTPPPGAAERFEARMGELGEQLGSRKLGYNITAVPPGKRAFPFHSHRVNEEMFFVLEGSGEIRIGKTRHAIRVGDVIACPPGGPESAHQIINTGITELKYLAVSSVLSPELCEYPDSGKYAVTGEFESDVDGKPRQFRVMSRAGEAVGYWEGE